MQDRRAKQEERSAATQQLAEEEGLRRLPVDPAQLVQELANFFADRAYLPEGAALVLAYFAINSYSFDVFDSTPYICLESAVPRCGKSTVMRLLEAVARKALNVTAMNEPIFRLIDQEWPTLLVDEAEGLEGHTDRAEALRTILHEGYKKGARVPRCVGEDHGIRFFAIFGPKVFAAIGGISGALLDRCIVLHMERMPAGTKLRSSRIRPLKRDTGSLTLRLRAYAIQYRDSVQALYDNEPDEGYWPDVTDREAELWGPLLIHARVAHAEEQLLAVVLQFGKSKASIEAEDWHTAKAVALLQALEALDGTTFSPGDLVDTLMESEAWSLSFGKLKAADEKVRRKGMAAKIGYALKNYRLKPVGRTAAGKEYDRIAAINIIGAHVPQNHTDHTRPTSTDHTSPQPPESKDSVQGVHGVYGLGVVDQKTETETPKHAQDSVNDGGNEGLDEGWTSYEDDGGAQ